MKIHVRRRHIDAGYPTPGMCPIALACKDILGASVRVHGTWMIAPSAVFDLPDTAQSFIARFDAGKPVKPFAFVLK